MNIAIIACAGKGTRMDKETNKVFLELGGKPILHHTLNSISDSVDKIIIVTRKDDLTKITELANEFPKVISVIEGGAERQDSVYNGILEAEKTANDSDIILIHNGCNPFVKEEEIKAVISKAEETGASALAFPAKDTLKRVNKEKIETVDRKNIWCMQTPQAMSLKIAKEAFENAKEKGISATDDISLVQEIGKTVSIVPCSYKNFKITTQEDLKIAELLIETKTLVGMGQDSHRFGTSGKLKLGGIQFEHPQLEAWSDGDVVLHSLFNAISSALGGKSIGYYFPDKADENRDRDSKEFFEKIFNMLDEKGYKLRNVSIAIEGKNPKLEPHIDEMKTSIAELLKIEKEKVGITATTGEGLTPFGTGLGMQCFTYVSLIK